MKPYPHLFFDLDHTLWDFDTNAQLTLHQLYQDFDLGQQWDASREAFIEAFFVVLHQLWDDYNHARITKDQLRTWRFPRIAERLTGRKFDPMPELEATYQQWGSSQPGLMPYAHQTLEDLHRKGYKLHILTNGFQESQYTKLEASGIAHFFDTLTTSECTGKTKPDPAIFAHALDKSGAGPGEVILIGDNPSTDLEGAAAAGWDAVFYNPQQKPTQSPFRYHVQCLRELSRIFD
ncbi:MAG: YjjG family noncanonical pyrimidine nucleotidase [Bernardetiaceae bacterium]